MKEVVNVYFGFRFEKENVGVKEELVLKVLRYVKVFGEKGEFVLFVFGVCVIYLC